MTCPYAKLRPSVGDRVCHGGLIWQLNRAPDTWAKIGECTWEGHRDGGTNAAPMNPLMEEPNYALFRAAMMEPWKREGYEDARLGMPIRELDRLESLKYEEGRTLFAEVQTIMGGSKVPPWLEADPPPRLVRLCLKWNQANPNTMLLPATVKVRHIAPPVGVHYFERTPERHAAGWKGGRRATIRTSLMTVKSVLP